ncbi:MAG: tetratricopeptide repeat protein [Thermoclostridium sp.]|nr:tetratricopeptide repeat protein [Thermoclostridium sp.]
MLDTKMELEGYQPIDLESVQESSGTLPENVVEAIVLFNKALEDVRFGNEDMAVIALKKAISLHPVFYEAMNLMGICYMAIGKEDMAENAFKQVIDADDSSIRALEYLNKMKGLAPDAPRNDTHPAKKKEKPVKHKPQQTQGDFSSFLAKGLGKENNNIYGLKYIAGMLMGMVLVLFIWWMVPTNKSLFTVKRVENIQQDPQLVEKINKLNERIKNLEIDLQASKDENLSLSESFEQYKGWSVLLEQAEAEFTAGNFIQAADLLTKNPSPVPAGFTLEHKNLLDKVRLEAANLLYKEAGELYDGNTLKDPEVYRQAFEKFESAITYLQADKPNYKANLYYQAGKAAARCEEIDRAVELFEAIIDNFPASQYSSYAAVRLKEIADGKPISGT